MKRRSLLQGAAATMLGAPALSGFAQQSVTLKFHTFMAPQSNVWLSMHKPWMDKVEKDSGGRIKFEAYPAMQLGGTPVQLYEQARDGVGRRGLDLARAIRRPLPACRGVRAAVHHDERRGDLEGVLEYIQTMAPDEFKETQVIALQVHGPGMFHTTSKQIKSPADLKGMKVRGPTRQVTKLLGALAPTPVGMPLPQIPDALSKGHDRRLRDPVGGRAVGQGARADQVPQRVPGQRPGALHDDLRDGDEQGKYEGLAPDLKKVIDANSGMATSAWLGKVQQGNDPVGKKPAVERGNTIYTLSDAEAKEFIKVSQAIDDEWVAEMNKRNFDGKKLLETARALIAKHSKG
jgi:TRAP-type C4-dicarboxylate transport system substrate-binding protein